MALNELLCNILQYIDGFWIRDQPEMEANFLAPHQSLSWPTGCPYCQPHGCPAPASVRFDAGYRSPVNTFIYSFVDGKPDQPDEQKC